MAVKYRELALRVITLLLGLSLLQFIVPFTLTSILVINLEALGVLIFGLGVLFIYYALRTGNPLPRLATSLTFIVLLLVFFQLFIYSGVLGVSYGIIWGINLWVFLFSAALGTAVLLAYGVKVMSEKPFKGLKVKAYTPLIALLLISLTINVTVNTAYQNWLEGKIDRYQPEAPRLMMFGVHVADLGVNTLTSPNDLNYHPISAEVLKAAGEAGAEVAVVFLFYDAWMEGDNTVIGESEKLVEAVKASGLRLFTVDQGARYMLQDKNLSLTEFTAIHRNYTRFFAERFKPEYYSVVSEPDTYHYTGAVKEAFNLTAWVEEAKASAREVKKVSPDTKVGVSIYYNENELKFYREAIKLKELDFIGLNIYSYGSSALHLFNTDVLEMFQQVIDQDSPRNYGKELWITETWNGVGGSLFQGWKEDSDAKWIRATAYFAEANGMEGCVINYGYHLISYRGLWMGGEVDLPSRTKVFYALKALTEETRER
ncbi:MAG: hypothetical protein QXO32_06140 [Candidatus Bathyarchaeia archaeon]